MKQAVYFYKQFKINIPIAVCKYDDIKSLLFLPEETLDELYKLIPSSNKTVYTLLDGVEFKVVAKL